MSLTGSSFTMREAIGFMEATKLFSARQVKSWRSVTLQCNFFDVKFTEFSEACNPHSTSCENLEIIDKFVTSKIECHTSA